MLAAACLAAIALTVTRPMPVDPGLPSESPTTTTIDSVPPMVPEPVEVNPEPRPAATPEPCPPGESTPAPPLRAPPPRGRTPSPYPAPSAESPPVTVATVSGRLIRTTLD